MLDGEKQIFDIQIQEGSIAIDYHTHPNNNLLSDKDIESGIDLNDLVANTSSLTSFYQVLYIPKMQKFYWFQYKKFKMPKRFRKVIMGSQSK